MRIKMMNKASMFLTAVAFVFATAVGALAAPYYTAGSVDNGTYGTALQFDYSSGGKTLVFSGFSNTITGPGGDTIINNRQTITGSYSLSLDSGSIYNLTKVGGVTPSTISVKNIDLDTTYFAAQATALKINFTTGTISWSSITPTTYNNTILSTAIDDLQAASTYAFTSFTFGDLAAVNTWLSGSSGLQTARYYSKLEGFSAVPEPGEWALMLIGLGMLGFYLHRRGYLNVNIFPQAMV